MSPRRLRLALLISIISHGLFILTARYRLSYDAYTHMLFADHYASDWFSLWETRWYTGFEVVSYPPLTHQLIALFVPLIGFDAAYALILWTVASLYPLGIHVFARIFTGRAAASYAALACALLLPLYVTAHIFGQLPFLTSTLFALFGAAMLARYLREGGFLNLSLTVALAATTMAAHHATLLVQPCLILAILVSQLGKKNWRVLLARLALFGILAVLAGLLVIWPFWEWGMHQTLQTPIDHPSRHNLFTDSFARAIFFWPLYGPLVAIIPFIYYKWPARFWGLTASFTILFLFGLGGTTRLPALVFGEAWEWLTYDRFTFWASLTLLPFFGILFILLKRRWNERFTLRLIPASLRRRLISALTFSVFAATSLGSWLTPYLFPSQPAPINMQPIVDFLEEGDRSQWRYLTLGFGNQFAYLNLLTTATTIDGSYNTARSLPELRSSGIAEIDTVFWSSQGIPAIRPILKKSGEYGVRWGFVNSKQFMIPEMQKKGWKFVNRGNFVPELRRDGWVFVKFLRNGVQVWENPGAKLPPPIEPPPVDPWASFSWGVFPLLALSTTAGLAGLRLRPETALNALRGIHSIAIGLLPVSLVFWFFHRLTDIEYPLVYFTYDNVLFFISDALALLAVLSWSMQRMYLLAQRSRQTLPGTRSSWRIFFSSANGWLFGLCVLASLSILWSLDWRISLYVSLHLWLVYGLFLSVQDRPELWRTFAIGASAALALQVFFGIWQFAIQSTAFMTPLNLEWLPALEPAMRGVSVVQLSDGTRLMRVYGSLPHPNILAGLILAFLPGSILIHMKSAQRNIWLLILFCLSITLLALTFSRAAWIGAVAAAAVIVFGRHTTDRKRLVALALAALIGMLAVFIPLRDYVFVRVTNAPVPTEQGSWQVRLWLTERAWHVIQEHPWLGVGVGTYTVASVDGLSAEILGVPEDSHLEPVHSVPLLILGELGPGGLILVIGLGMKILLSGLRARGLETLFFSSALIGLCAAQFFDHFLWTLPPGRLLFGLILGLWAGQAKRDESDRGMAVD